MTKLLGEGRICELIQPPCEFVVRGNWPGSMVPAASRSARIASNSVDFPGVLMFNTIFRPARARRSRRPTFPALVPVMPDRDAFAERSGFGFLLGRSPKTTCRTATSMDLTSAWRLGILHRSKIHTLRSYPVKIADVEGWSLAVNDWEPDLSVE
jgi:hypothetical protein